MRLILAVGILLASACGQRLAISAEDAADSCGIRQRTTYTEDIPVPMTWYIDSIKTRPSPPMLVIDSAGFACGLDSKPGRFVIRITKDSTAAPGCGKDGCCVMHYGPTYHWRIQLRAHLGFVVKRDTVWYGLVNWGEAADTDDYWEVNPDPRRSR